MISFSPQKAGYNAAARHFFFLEGERLGGSKQGKRCPNKPETGMFACVCVCVWLYCTGPDGGRLVHLVKDADASTHLPAAALPRI